MKEPAKPAAVRTMSRGERRATYAVKVLLILAAGLFLLTRVLDFFGAIATAGLLVVAAMFFAYLIYPIVRRLAARMPTVVAILIAYVAIAVLVAVAVVTVVPPLAEESQRLVKEFPSFVVRAQIELATPTDPLVARIPVQARTYLGDLPAQFGSLVQTYGFDAAQKTLRILLSAVSILAAVVIVPVLAAYMLIDADTVRAEILGLFAPRARPKAEAVLTDLNKVIGGFIRGQLIDGAIVGVMIFIMLLILHVPYALLIGVAAGLLNFIPYAGAVIGFIPSVLLALFTNGPTSALTVAALFVVIQQIDGHFVAPRVLKDAVGLSPLYIIIAILVGTELFGLPGTFLAVPVAAMLRVLRIHLVPGGKAS
jgi:predicted PurR-regulated permease PerM